MDYFKEFVIPFKGLKPGGHNFEFEITEKFFDHFEYGELKKGNLKLDFSLLKEETMLTLSFDIRGVVEVLCDRCGEAFGLPVKTKKSLYVKFGQEAFEESDEVIVIPASEYQIDISQYIYEFINLSLPYRKIHPQDESGNEQCNEDVINQLENIKKESSTDPRWDALKKIKNED